MFILLKMIAFSFHFGIRKISVDVFLTNANTNRFVCFCRASLAPDFEYLSPNKLKKTFCYEWVEILIKLWYSFAMFSNIYLYVCIYILHLQFIICRYHLMWLTSQITSFHFNIKIFYFYHFTGICRQLPDYYYKATLVYYFFVRS